MLNATSESGCPSRLLVVVCVVLIVSVGGAVRAVAQSLDVPESPAVLAGRSESSPIRIQPRRPADPFSESTTQRSGESPRQLPEIIPAPAPYDRARDRKVRTVEDQLPAWPAIEREISNRTTWRIMLSRTVRSTLDQPADSAYEYVNPSNRENFELTYDAKTSVTGRWNEFELGAPWQFPYKIHKGTITYRLSRNPFTAVDRIDELDALCDEFRKYRPVLTRNSVLNAYSSRDNFFQRDVLLRLKRNVPETLLEKMNASEIDDDLIAYRRHSDRKGPCELKTILWLTGLLEKIEQSVDRRPAGDETLEVFVNYSEPVLVYQEGIYYFIYNQCFLTAIRSTLEPDVIHLCVIEFEMHKYKEFISGVVPNVYDLRRYRYKLSKTWSLGTLE